MKRINFKKRLRNKTVWFYLLVVLAAGAVAFGYLGEGEMREIAIVVATIASIMGIIDDPNASKFLSDVDSVVTKVDKIKDATDGIGRK